MIQPDCGSNGGHMIQPDCGSNGVTWYSLIVVAMVSHGTA